ncbi:alpha,alpha-trehalose-phosphate synthase [UDP-forming] 1-like [Salvia divinorum]|uniref:Alpha,alpha-trehalose-phosphate synthase [UDP-forming] 1-like n=1 Tax=Salvia divinorum TaxID=28513 RepID=A0ABD1FSA4_SALDI
MRGYSDYNFEGKLAWLCKRCDFSSTIYEDLVELKHELELSLNKLRAQKAQLILEEEENLKRMHHHIGVGIRFTVIKYLEEKMQYLDVDLKDVPISGFPAVTCDEGIVCEDLPTAPGVCRVGDALFMVGGRLKHTEVRYGREYCNHRETKWLWSAPAPPIAGGSYTMTWTRCDTAMDSGRSLPMVVPLHDGRIFICGGTSKPECWVEIYDPEKGEFDRRDLPEHIFEPTLLSCFLWADQSVMLYCNRVTIEEEEEEEEVNKPSLLLYDVERNNWEILAENLPASKHNYWEKSNLIYVGGSILFIIDQASCWFVYDLSAKKEVGKVDVRVKDGKVMKALYLGNNDIKNTSWIFYIFLPDAKRDMKYHPTFYTNLRYAKVEVVQVKGGDYIATVQFSGVLKIGDFDKLYIIADEASLKRAAEDCLKEREEDDK